jgi:predicted nuclease of predicted toxin-antitoxin system
MTAYRFLIDENLSPHLKHALIPHTAIHTRDLGESLSDSWLWDHATAHRLVVLTKDADFVNRMQVSPVERSPRAVIQLHCGNLRAGSMRLFLVGHLEDVIRLLDRYRLIHLYPDHIEAF